MRLPRAWLHVCILTQPLKPTGKSHHVTITLRNSLVAATTAASKRSLPHIGPMLALGCEPKCYISCKRIVATDRKTGRHKGVASAQKKKVVKSKTTAEKAKQIKNIYRSFDDRFY